MVGRLDPKTGEIKLKQVPTSHAEPYGIAVTHSGVPYFCEFGSNRLASVDPKTLVSSLITWKALAKTVLARGTSGWEPSTLFSDTWL